MEVGVDGDWGSSTAGSRAVSVSTEKTDHVCLRDCSDTVWHHKWNIPARKTALYVHIIYCSVLYPTFWHLGVLSLLNFCTKLSCPCTASRLLYVLQSFVYKYIPSGMKSTSETSVTLGDLCAARRACLSSLFSHYTPITYPFTLRMRLVVKLAHKQ